MANPRDELAPPMDAGSMGQSKATNLNLTKSEGNGNQPRKFAAPPRATPSEATRSGGQSGGGMGAFSQPEPTPLAVPDWLQAQQDEANAAVGGTPVVESPAMVMPTTMTAAERAIWEVKQAMIAPHQAAIDAINANADVIIPLLQDLKQLQGLIAATEDKNVMMEGVASLMAKLSDRIGA